MSGGAMPQGSIGRAVRSRPKLGAVAVWGATGMALLVIVQAIALVIRFYDIYPFGDMIDVIYRFFAGPTRDFWIYHDNEHLPLFAMPLYWIDLRLFGAQGIFLVICTLAFALAIALIPAGAILRSAPGRLPLAIAISTTNAALYLWLGNYINFVWTKQVHMYLSLFAVMMAIRAATLARPALARDTLGIVAWLIVATFSFGYGMVGFVSVAAIGVARRWPRRSLAAIAAAAVVAMTVYAGIALPLRNGALAAVFLAHKQGPANYLPYAATFMSSPPFNVAAPFAPQAAALGIAWCVGLCALVAFATGTSRWVARPPSELGAWALGLGVFSLCVALQTCLARAEMFEYVLAADSRYIIAQLPFYTALVFIATERMHLSQARAQAGLGLGLLAVSAGLLASQQAIVPAMRAHNHERWISAMSALDQISDPRVSVRDDFFYPDRVNFVAQGLHARGWSVFAWPQARWLGRDLAFFGKPAHGCVGRVDSIVDVGRSGGWRVEGWAGSGATKLAVSWLLIADPSGRIAGVAHAGGDRFDVAAALHSVNLRDSGWTGYVPHSLNPAQLAVYALLGAEHPCRIGAAPGPARP